MVAMIRPQTQTHKYARGIYKGQRGIHITLCMISELFQGLCWGNVIVDTYCVVLYVAGEGEGGQSIFVKPGEDAMEDMGGIFLGEIYIL